MILTTSCPDPPQELLDVVFPWVEGEQAALRAREKQNHYARDIALKQFLRLLLWLRRVLLQDAALLFVNNPHADMFKYAPFNTPSFRQFALGSTAAIDAAEEQARVTLLNLPQEMAHSMHSVVANNSLEMQRLHAEHCSELQGMREEVTHMRGAIDILLGSKRGRRRGTFIYSTHSLPKAHLILLQVYFSCLHCLCHLRLAPPSPEHHL
jgi:hypothetical protein